MDSCVVSGIDVEAQRATLAREAQALRELLEVEPNSKWCMLTLARVLEAQHAKSSDATATDTIEEVRRLYGTLTNLVRRLFVFGKLNVLSLSYDATQTDNCTY